MTFLNRSDKRGKLLVIVTHDDRNIDVRDPGRRVFQIDDNKKIEELTVKRPQGFTTTPKPLSAVAEANAGIRCERSQHRHDDRCLCQAVLQRGLA